MRRRSVRRTQNRPEKPLPAVRQETPKTPSGKGYIPNVRPFMQGAGYTEGLEEILAEIDRLQMGRHFDYEQGDLWRKKP